MPFRDTAVSILLLKSLLTTSIVLYSVASVLTTPGKFSILPDIGMIYREARFFLLSMTNEPSSF